MKNAIAMALCTGLMLVGFQAIADDAMSSSGSMSHKQMMKDCMARQKAKDSTLSTDELKRACQDEMKMKADPPNQTPPSPPPQPANPTNPPQ